MKGSCLCGAVSYLIEGPLRSSVACHCSQCRKTSGHYWSATQVNAEQITIVGADALTWFRSSPKAERGFCSLCGSSLFWRHDDDGGAVSIGSGTLDGPSGTTETKHIYLADKGDYYRIPDGVLKEEG